MDTRLCELERDVKRGVPGAEAELLQAKLRAGHVSRGDLMLAAFCGHAPSYKVLAPGGPAGSDWYSMLLGAVGTLRPQEVDAYVWVSGLVNVAGRVEDPPVAMTAVRIGLSIVKAALNGAPGQRRIRMLQWRQVMIAAKAWLRDPTEENLAELRRLWEEEKERSPMLHPGITTPLFTPVVPGMAVQWLWAAARHYAVDNECRERISRDMIGFVFGRRR